MQQREAKSITTIIIITINASSSFSSAAILQAARPAEVVSCVEYGHHKTAALRRAALATLFCSQRRRCGERDIITTYVIFTTPVYITSRAALLLLLQLPSRTRVHTPRQFLTKLETTLKYPAWLAGHCSVSTNASHSQWTRTIGL